MGIMVVLIFYAIVLGGLAVAGSLAFAFLVSRLTHKEQNGRKRAITLAAIFPYACLVWAGLWFVGYATINWSVFHRDPMLGDTWETRLPNGYGIMMIDVTDQGTVYNPATQTQDGSISSRADARFGVRRLQVAGSLIYCAADKGYFEKLGRESTEENQFVLLDTKSGTQTEFASEAEMATLATQHGTILHLEPILNVYSRYRQGWFEILAGIVLVVVPLTAFVFLARFVWRVREGRLRLLITMPPETAKS